MVALIQYDRIFEKAAQAVNTTMKCSEIHEILPNITFVKAKETLLLIYFSLNHPTTECENMHYEPQNQRPTVHAEI